MAKRLSVKEILEAARKGGPAKPADETAPAAEAAAEAAVEEQEAAAAPEDSEPLLRLRRRPRRMFRRLPRWGGRSRSRKSWRRPAPAGRPHRRPQPKAPAAAPAAKGPAAAAEPAEEAAPAEAPKAVPPPAKPLGRPMTLAEKLAAARGGGAPAAAAPAAGQAGRRQGARGGGQDGGGPRASAAREDDRPPRPRRGRPPGRGQEGQGDRRQGGRKGPAEGGQGRPPSRRPFPLGRRASSPRRRPARPLSRAGGDFSEFTIAATVAWIIVAWVDVHRRHLRHDADDRPVHVPQRPGRAAQHDQDRPARRNYEPEDVNERFKAEWGFWIVRSTRYNGQDIIYALQSVCTHLGCPPNWLAAEQKFKCPCHGSGFYISGINFEGPRPGPWSGSRWHSPTTARSWSTRARSSSKSWGSGPTRIASSRSESKRAEHGVKH